LFYTPDAVWEEIQPQPDILRIFRGKFSNVQIQKSKTETKAELEGEEYKHLVYDDGNNNNRIYYFQEKGRIYVYKTFENEEDAKKFIRKPKQKTHVIQSSTVKKLEK
jgi:hypothetical protein